jgi:hypothetical protein
MNIASLINVLQSALLLIVLISVAFWLWPSVRLDSFRQNMFSLRDELFDYAASGKIEFGHPAYRLLRQSMNGFIRHGHRLSVFQIVIDLITWRVAGHPPAFDWTERWNAALASIKDRQVMADLVRFHERESFLVCQRVVLGSPFLIFVFAAGLFVGLFRAGWTSLHSVFNAAVSGATARLIDPRLLDEQAARAAI